MPRVYPSARDRILDAAERLILARGVGQLSVESVATEAKVSKGGFFHHFATKDELLMAILDRLVERVNRELEALAANDPEPRGARLRAQIAMSFDMDKATFDRFCALPRAFIEAAGAIPSLSRRARQLNEQTFTRDVAEGIPIGRAVLLQLALDGYALSQALGSIALSSSQRAALRDSMMTLARPEASPKRRSSRALTAKKGRHA